MKAFALAITPSVRAKQHEKFTAHLNQSKSTPGRQDQGQWGLAITVTPSVLLILYPIDLFLKLNTNLTYKYNFTDALDAAASNRLMGGMDVEHVVPSYCHLPKSGVSSNLFSLLIHLRSIHTGHNTFFSGGLLLLSWPS